jgi:hypothetical protein
LIDIFRLLLKLKKPFLFSIPKTPDSILTHFDLEFYKYKFSVTNINMGGNYTNKRIGILGGMGPYATVIFMKNILDMTDAEKDWEHIHTIVDNNTKIPSRSRAILFNETSPLDGMLESCKKLESYTVDTIVIPCNSESC